VRDLGIAILYRRDLMWFTISKFKPDHEAQCRLIGPAFYAERGGLRSLLAQFSCGIDKTCDPLVGKRRLCIDQHQLQSHTQLGQLLSRTPYQRKTRSTSARLTIQVVRSRPTSQSRRGFSGTAICVRMRR
jgi:hypothetical protein